MLAHERKQIILNKLQKANIVRVSDLSEILKTSEATIRRDLKSMEDEGLLRRTHGGAIANVSAAFEPKISDLALEHVDEKRTIAQFAYSLINDKDAIIIDSSSTGHMLATCIRENSSKSITVVTNAIKVAWELMDLLHVDLIMVGGQIRNNVFSCIGDIAERTLANLRVDKAFIGINGINFADGAGFTTPNMFESQIKRSMIKASKQVYILADSSKFNQSFLSIVCPISAVDYIITDSGVSKETIDQSVTFGVELLISPKNISL